jgi:hypothetical protein
VISRCKDCKSELNPGATKCAACGSQQSGFRRWASPFPIAFGYAVTVFTILNFPQIKDMWESKRAEITVSTVGSDPMSFVFMVSNTGNRPAAINSVDVRSTIRDGKPIWYFVYSPLSGTLLKPGEAALAKAEKNNALPSDNTYAFQSTGMDKKMSPNCVLEVDIVQMDGRREQINHPFYCIPYDPADRFPGRAIGSGHGDH